MTEPSRTEWFVFVSRTLHILMLTQAQSEGDQKLRLPAPALPGIRNTSHKSKSIREPAQSVTVADVRLVARVIP